ncbi:hypothetical protein L218DRAFT_996574 [Marasmius fiardii PR-910]|nr:hypothetical protein L218DRAFT_996574 [Marasmius fiardii PR-910]
MSTQLSDNESDSGSQRTSQKALDGQECDICGVVIARRGDMPRHRRLHAAPEAMDDMLHRCSWKGCTYASLQKPNVQVHYRTHTKERNQVCPDCDSKFSDPGSLIRHRKNLHGYVPTARKKPQRLVNTSSESPGEPSSPNKRGSIRHQPYSKSDTVSSVSSGLFLDPTTPTSPTSPTSPRQADASPEPPEQSYSLKYGSGGCQSHSKSDSVSSASEGVLSADPTTPTSPFPDTQPTS